MAPTTTSLPPSGPQPTSPARPDRGWPLGATLCLALATALTVVLAAPVLETPTERMFGSEIVGRYHDPYTVAAWFDRPTGPRTQTQPVTDYAGALLARLTGGVAAYNIVVLASFPLAALFAYLLTFHLTRHRTAALLAALFYAFSPFHLAHAAYHAHIAQTQWLPLYLLALWRALERASPGRLALLAVALGLTALSSFYFGLIAIVLTPFALVGFVALMRPTADHPTGREAGRVVATLAGMAALGGAWVIAFASRVLIHQASVAFPRSDLDRYAARWFGYLVPPVDHPLFGARAAEFWRSRGLGPELLEQQIQIGLGLALLAATACWLWWRRRRSAATRAVPLLVLVAGVAFLFSLSPERVIGGVTIPRPSLLLWELAPMFRAHARFGLVVGLAVAVLAGIGFTGLMARRGSGARLFASGCLVLALVELTPWPPWRWRDVLPTTAHRWLAENRPAGRVLDCVPVRDLAHHSVPRLFGPGLELLPASRDCDEPHLAGKLAAEGFSHLLVRRATATGERHAIGPLPPGLALARTFDDALLLAVAGPPEAISLELARGFFDREHRREGSFRWLGGEGAVLVVNRTGGPATIRIRVRLHAFPRHRVLRATAIRTGTESALEIGPTPAVHLLGPYDLVPGSQEIRLRTDSPATRAGDVTGSDDRRAVAVAFWEWQVELLAPSGEPPASRPEPLSSHGSG